VATALGTVGETLNLLTASFRMAILWSAIASRISRKRAECDLGRSGTLTHTPLEILETRYFFVTVTDALAALLVSAAAVALTATVAGFGTTFGAL